MQKHRDKIRLAIKQVNRNIKAPKREKAAHILAERCMDLLPLDRSCMRIAVYLPLPYELDTRPLVRRLWQEKISIYAPRMHAETRQLSFHVLLPDSPLVKVGGGMLEPDASSEQIAIADLDWVIVPALYLTSEGGRLGSGYGYYDRSFAFKKNQRVVKPILLGVAYEQRLSYDFQLQAWDVCCDQIICIKPH